MFRHFRSNLIHSVCSYDYLFSALSQCFAWFFFFSFCAVSMRNTLMWQGKLQSHERSENIIQDGKVTFRFLRF